MIEDVSPIYCSIERGAFDRWYIFHPWRKDLAWSGAKWAETVNGIPRGRFGICNFSSAAEALDYAERRKFDLEAEAAA